MVFLVFVLSDNILRSDNYYYFINNYLVTGSAEGFSDAEKAINFAVKSGR